MSAGEHGGRPTSSWLPTVFARWRRSLQRSARFVLASSPITSFTSTVVGTPPSDRTHRIPDRAVTTHDRRAPSSGGWSCAPRSGSPRRHGRGGTTVGGGLGRGRAARHNEREPRRGWGDSDSEALEENVAPMKAWLTGPAPRADAIGSGRCVRRPWPPAPSMAGRRHHERSRYWMPSIIAEVSSNFPRRRTIFSS